MNKLRDTGTDSPYDSTAACSVLHINGKVQYRSGFYSTADAWPAGSCLPACLPACLPDPDLPIDWRYCDL